jgi:hypothetical protein
MRKVVGLVLCVSVLVLAGGCDGSSLSTLAGLAGVDISGISVDTLLNQMESLLVQTNTGSQAKEGSWVATASDAAPKNLLFNLWR